MTYSLKNLKTFTGMEGGGYEASLYKGNTKIGTAMNAGDGGSDIFRFVSREAESEFTAFANDWYETSDSKREWDEFVAQNKLDSSPDGATAQAHKLESWVSEEEGRMETKKWLKRNAKNKTLFRLLGDEKGTWRTINKTGQTVIDQILKKYSGKIEVIYGANGITGPATNSPAVLNF